MDGDQQQPALAVPASSEFAAGSDVLANLRRLESKNILEEEKPTHLDPRTSGPFLTVSADKLSVKYSNDDWDGAQDDDVGAIRGNCPSPRQTPMYYFELSVKNRGRECFIGIGFADEAFEMNRQPGWERNSYGYHGDDGSLFAGSGEPLYKGFGPTFSTGDIVGAGINYLEQELFFTKNGKLIDMTWLDDIERALYPTVGLHSPNEEVEVNFGQKPFMFNVEAFKKEVQDRLQEDDNVQ